jgi:hypothetical protein
MREVAPDVRKNTDFKNRRVVVIVLDDATPVAAQDVLQYPKLARRVIDGLAPGDMASVVFAMDQRAGQEFTEDRALLRAAVDRFNAPDPLPGMGVPAGMPTPGSFDGLDGSKATNYQFDVPVSKLAPGPHLLTVQATAGHHVVRRDVRFLVKR